MSKRAGDERRYTERKRDYDSSRSDRPHSQRGTSQDRYRARPPEDQGRYGSGDQRSQGAHKDYKEQRGQQHRRGRADSPLRSHRRVPSRHDTKARPLNASTQRHERDLVALAVVLVNITSLYGHSFKERPDKEHEFRFPEDLWPLIKHIGRSTIIVVLDQDTQELYGILKLSGQDRTGKSTENPTLKIDRNGEGVASLTLAICRNRQKLPLSLFQQVPGLLRAAISGVVAELSQEAATAIREVFGSQADTPRQTEEATSPLQAQEEVEAQKRQRNYGTEEIQAPIHIPLASRQSDPRSDTLAKSSHTEDLRQSIKEEPNDDEKNGVRNTSKEEPSYQEYSEAEYGQVSPTDHTTHLDESGLTYKQYLSDPRISPPISTPSAPREPEAPYAASPVYSPTPDYPSIADPNQLYGDHSQYISRETPGRGPSDEVGIQSYKETRYPEHESNGRYANERSERNRYSDRQSYEGMNNEDKPAYSELPLELEREKNIPRQSEDKLGREEEFKRSDRDYSTRHDSPHTDPERNREELKKRSRSISKGREKRHTKDDAKDRARSSEKGPKNLGGGTVDDFMKEWDRSHQEQEKRKKGSPFRNKDKYQPHLHEDAATRHKSREAGDRREEKIRDRTEVPRGVSLERRLKHRSPPQQARSLASPPPSYKTHDDKRYDEREHGGKSARERPREDRTSFGDRKDIERRGSDTEPSRAHHQASTFHRKESPNRDHPREVAKDRYVPERENATTNLRHEDGGAVAQKDENTATTLFIGNVPQGLTAERAAKALDSLGLKDTYDFFFFKETGEKWGSLGINMISHAKAQQLHDNVDKLTAEWHGGRLPRRGSHINWNNYQGKEKLQRQYFGYSQELPGCPSDYTLTSGVPTFFLMRNISPADRRMHNQALVGDTMGSGQLPLAPDRNVNPASGPQAQAALPLAPENNMPPAPVIPQGERPDLVIPGDLLPYLDQSSLNDITHVFQKYRGTALALPHSRAYLLERPTAFPPQSIIGPHPPTQMYPPAQEQPRYGSSVIQPNISAPMHPPPQMTHHQTEDRPRQGIEANGTKVASAGGRRLNEQAPITETNPTNLKREDSGRQPWRAHEIYDSKDPDRLNDHSSKEKHTHKKRKTRSRSRDRSDKQDRKRHRHRETKDSSPKKREGSFEEHHHSSRHHRDEDSKSRRDLHKQEATTEDVKGRQNTQMSLEKMRDMASERLRNITSGTAASKKDSEYGKLDKDSEKNSELQGENLAKQEADKFLSDLNNLDFDDYVAF